MSRVCGCLGVEKRGGNLLFGSLPAFSSFCVERTTGLEPAAFTLGWWCSGLVSYVRKCVFPGCPLRLLFVCAWLSLGFGADDGSRTRNFHRGMVALYQIELHPQCAPTSLV